jgi:flagellar protein FlbD
LLPLPPGRGPANHDEEGVLALIRLTRFCGDSVFVNCDLIEIVERNPDTVLTLVSGNRLTVQESPEEIANLVRVFRHSLLRRDSKDLVC